MSDEIKYIDIGEFCERGYLQEANRQFFHPLGLALEVTVEEDGSARLGGVWDYREDPEGIVFDGPADYGPDDYGLDQAKALRVARDLEAHEAARRKMFGQIVQPLTNDLDKR